MLLSTLLALAVSYFWGAEAAPSVGSTEHGQSARVFQAEAGNLPPGPVAYLHALKKHGKAVPSQVAVAAASATQKGAVQATDLPFDKAYLVNVTVGHAQLLLDFDTGSSDFWVFSTAMPAAQRGKHHLYGLGGRQAPGETWDISYIDGAGASGVVYADKVQIGAVTATVQAVEAATSASSAFVNGANDGIVGLAFEEGNTCSPNLCYTIMDNLAPTLASPLFTATLRHGRPGEYDFGYIDTSKYTGALTYVARNDNQEGGYWEVAVTGFSLNGGAQVARAIDAVVDTGTSLVLADQAVVNAYYANVPNAHYNSTLAAVIFPCANANHLPSLGFWMGGKAHTMPAAYGNYAQLAQPAGYCYGAIQSNNGGSTVLGDAWLKSQFVVFNYNKGRLTATVGFAQQAGVTV